MIIRKAVDGEDGNVLAFYHDLIDKMKDKEYRPSWTKGVYPTREDIHEAIYRSELFLAIDNGDIVGAFILNHTQGEGYDKVPWKTVAESDKTAVIHLLAVDPAQHGKGIGKALLRKAVEVCREAGDEVIRLDTLPRNIPGQRLYEGFGFQYCGEIELTYASTGTIPFRMYEYVLRRQYESNRTNP